jgi:predicted phage tail protein
VILSPKNIRRGPFSSILGAILIAVPVWKWTIAGQWTEGHSFICLLGVAMIFSPDSLKPKAKE